MTELFLLIITSLCHHNDNENYIDNRPYSMFTVTSHSLDTEHTPNCACVWCVSSLLNHRTPQSAVAYRYPCWFSSEWCSDICVVGHRWHVVATFCRHEYRRKSAPNQKSKTKLSSLYHNTIAFASEFWNGFKHVQNWVTSVQSQNANVVMWITVRGK